MLLSPWPLTSLQPPAPPPSPSALTLCPHLCPRGLLGGLVVIIHFAASWIELLVPVLVVTTLGLATLLAGDILRPRPGGLRGRRSRTGWGGVRWGARGGVRIAAGYRVLRGVMGCLLISRYGATDLLGGQVGIVRLARTRVDVLHPVASDTLGRHGDLKGSVRSLVSLNTSLLLEKKKVQTFV